MNKKILAYKSNKFMTLGVFYSMALLFFFGLSIYLMIIKEIFKEAIGILVIDIPLLTFVLIYFIPIFISKRIILEYDDVGVYINYSKRKIIYIPYKDINNVIDYKFTQKRLFNSSVWTTYGTLRIVTKTKVYKIRCVEEISSAQKFIFKRIAWKYYRIK